MRLRSQRQNEECVAFAVEKQVKITVRSILSIKDVLGSREIEIRASGGCTLGQLLELMIEKWGEKLASKIFDAEGQVLRHTRLIINGQDIAFLNGMETELKEGDEVLILPPVAGG
ncbi:MAG: MoaD family protein [Deltaproteobacteria bacterium]|nr:MoaD family protein [Deltaproteobacteria bacterium]MBW2137459.1 MoaD family protein [Deltaproteobacteria bacterium]